MNLPMPGEEAGVRSPDSSKNKTLDVIKSQKNLNSVTYFNTHDEQGKAAADPDKRPRAEKTQMRQTWNRQTSKGPPPRFPHYKKLDVFKPAAKSQAKEHVQKINMMEENNQYKNVQQYLSPLKLDEKKRKEADDRRSKQQRKESMNPLLPVKNHIKLAKQIKDKLDRDMQDLSIERVRALKTHMSLPSFKLQQFVTVLVIKRYQNTGAVKKMLHTPTMRLYVIKQQPIGTKQSRNAIVEWIGQWQTKICSYGAEVCDINPFIKVYSNFWYFPEGSVSILTEYCEGGSLQDLLDSVGTLPENVIKEICLPLVRTLSLYYSQTDTAFGGLAPSQILFTESGDFKLNMGLYSHGSQINSSNIFNTRTNFKQNPFEANSKFWSKWSPYQRSNSNNLEVQRSIDMIKLGFIIFMCSVGSFETYEQSAIIFENLRTLMMSEQGQKIVEKQNLCCLLHSQDFLLNYTDNPLRKVDTSKIFKYMLFIRGRFSNQFISFLCQCLKLSNKKRATVADLLAHPFLTTPSQPKTIKVNLVDLLKISRGWCEQTPSIELLDKKIDKLCDAISIVLSNCRRDSLYDLKNLDKERIAKLAKELGVRQQVLYRRFDTLLRQLEQRLNQ